MRTRLSRLLCFWVSYAAGCTAACAPAIVPFDVTAEKVFVAQEAAAISRAMPPLTWSTKVTTSCGVVTVARYGTALSPVELSVVGFQNKAVAISSGLGQSAVAYRQPDGTVNRRALGSGNGTCRVNRDDDANAGAPTGMVLLSAPNEVQFAAKGKSPSDPPTASSGATTADLTVGRKIRLALALGPKLLKQMGADACQSAIALAEQARVTFGRELAVDLERLPLVALPDEPRFQDPSQALDAVTKYLDAQFPAGYDIGHVLDYVNDAQGYGFGKPGSGCTNERAFGYTLLPDGNPNPAIELFMHEIAHQMGARHTHVDGDGVSDFSKYEPGSGTTVMSYAPQRDAYFHPASLDQISGWFKKGCGEPVPRLQSDAVLNSAPVGRQVPENTAFELELEAAGVECVRWSEVDNATIFDNALPLFRSFAECAERRSFPSEKAVLTGAYETGDRFHRGAHSLRFVAIAHTPEGRILATEVPVRMEPASGFKIDSLSCLASCKPGTGFEMTWKANGTDTLPYSISELALELSTNQGKKWTELKKVKNVAAGSLKETIPAGLVPGSTVYVRLKAVGGLFYAAAPLTIGQ